MRIIWATAVMGLALTSGLLSAEVSVRKGHPRIFYTAERIPELVRRCGPGGPVEAEYAGLKEWVDGFLQKKQALPGSGLPALCIVYQVEKGKGNDVTAYVRFLVDGLWGTDGKGGGSNLESGRQWFPQGAGHVLEGYMGGNGNWFSWDALAYDWFYDALTPEQRHKYGNLIGRWIHSFMGLKPDQPAEITLQWGNYIYNQTWGPAEGAWGNYYSRDGVGSKTMVALALAGEGTDYEASIQQWLASWADMVPNRFLPAIERMGGAWPSGPGHGGAAARSVMMILEAWNTATGQDLFPRFGLGGLREFSWWQVFGAMPHNESWAHQNDTGAGMMQPMQSAASSMAPLLASVYRQPQAQWLTEHSAAGESWNGSSWPRILWYDPEVRAAKPSEFPTAYLFRGTGQTYMRSGWTGPDDTWAYFVCGPHYVGYQSQEDGTFQIYKGGGLAMRSGTDRYSGVRTTSMNAVLIYNPQEMVAGEGRNRGRNDGGVLGNPGAPLEPVARGHLAAFQHEDAFTYAAADLAGAYDRSKVESYTRQFLYLRSDPECFVVYDRLAATKAEFPKLWLLHTMNEPVFYSGTRRLSTGGSKPGYTEYPEADRAITSNYDPENNPEKNAGQSKFLSTGFGAMLTRRLLPEVARTVARGGAGHDNWGNPANPEDDHNFDGGRGEGGSRMDRPWWRIEMAPSAAEKKTDFLHVLSPILVPKEHPKTAADLTLEDFPSASKPRVTGERVTFEVASKDAVWRVTLNRQGDAGGTVERLEKGRSVGKWNLATDVHPVVPKL